MTCRAVDGGMCILGASDRLNDVVHKLKVAGIENFGLPVDLSYSNNGGQSKEKLFAIKISLARRESELGFRKRIGL